MPERYVWTTCLYSRDHSSNEENKETARDVISASKLSHILRPLKIMSLKRM